MPGPGFEPRFSRWESATLLITLESRLVYNAVRLQLISTLLLINYVIILYIRHHVVKQNWKQILFSCFYDVKRRVNSCERKHVAKFLLPRTAGWHRNGLGSFSMEIIAYIGRPFFRFCWWICISFCTRLLQLYSNHLVSTVIFKTSRSNQMMAAILNLLMRSDQENGYLKNVHSLADGQTVTKYSAM